MSEFTKGKWYVTNNGVDIFVASTEIPGSICNVGWINVGNNEANAHLIAAAPEMYKILDGLIYKLKANGADEREEIDEAIHEIERLIERIDGEEEQE